MAECEAAVSGTTDSAHVASVDDPVGGIELSAMTLLQAAESLTLMSSSTSAITRNYGNILAVGDPVGGSECSAVMLLPAVSDAFTFTSATATATSTVVTELNEVVEPHPWS